MPGLGTIINVALLVAGGLLGLAGGRFITPRIQDTLMKASGLCVLFIGLGGTMQKMLIIDGKVLATTGTTMLIVSFALGSLIGEARRAGAGMYVTSDLRYNDFMEPDGALTVADIGHFESEYCAIDLLFDLLSENLINFAVRKSESSRNPVHYMV